MSNPSAATEPPVLQTTSLSSILVAAENVDWILLLQVNFLLESTVPFCIFYRNIREYPA